MEDSEKVLKDLEGALAFLPAHKNLNEFLDEVDEIIEKADSLTLRSNLYLSLARHLKHASQVDGTRDDYREAAKRCLKKSAEYGLQYETQKEMLPDCFDVDKPVSPT